MTAVAVKNGWNPSHLETLVQNIMLLLRFPPFIFSFPVKNFTRATTAQTTTEVRSPRTVIDPTPPTASSPGDTMNRMEAVDTNRNETVITAIIVITARNMASAVVITTDSDPIAVKSVR
jgi:hypothetical protein